MFCAAFALAVIGLIVSWNTAAFGFSFRDGISAFLRYGLIGAAIGIIPGIIYLCCERNEEKQLERDALDDYDARLVKEQNRVLREKEKAKRLMTVKNGIVSKREETKMLLARYYDADVIYPTYRNMIAMCTIYEYFKSGRCNELSGHEGAYNLYENEKRLNRIVDRLDVVIDRLEEIRANQYMLYTAIQEGNRTLNKVLKETYKQTEMQGFILEQTSIAAYNSDVAVQELKLSNWLKTYELTKLGV